MFEILNAQTAKLVNYNPRAEKEDIEQHEEEEVA